MKRMIPLFLCLCLLLSLGACAGNDTNRYTFYYLRTGDTIRYGYEDALVAPVTREISGQDPGLSYLLQRYLEGPVEEGYHSPIPKGTYLLSTLWADGTLVLVLSREFSTANGITLTLCGACLAATCHDLTGADRIEIHSGDAVYTFALTDFNFIDNSTDQGGKDPL